MDEKVYYGNEQQIRGVEEYLLTGGKTTGMRMMRVTNGLGLEVVISLDRNLDIPKVLCHGVNLAYLSPVGNVSPMYYDARGEEMVRSFTAGFLTTCGLDNVGGSLEMDGTSYPLHGRISNQPGEHCYWDEEEDFYRVHGTMRQTGLFLEKLELNRTIRIGKRDNSIQILDKIKNVGSQPTPCMILYHMNMGYPLLTENSILEIPSVKVDARTEYAREHIETWNEIEKPGSLSEEVCYFHSFNQDGIAKIYNPDIKKGVQISFDATKLKYFTQWKMMGKYDYVLGLEPGNCRPDGRKKILDSNQGVILKEQEEVTYQVNIKIVEG